VVKTAEIAETVEVDATDGTGDGSGGGGDTSS
jgi:hypothetical protein